MLSSIRRSTGIIGTHSPFASHRLQSCWVLLQFPFTSLRYTSTTDQNSNLVLETLKDHGFTDTHIAKLVQRAPWILSSNPESTIGSKISYLCMDLGLERSELVKIITSDPLILRSSLENTIIPSVNYLTAVLGTRTDAARALVREPWLLRPAHSKVAANVGVLKGLGVPDWSISKLLLTHPRTLMHAPARFRELVDAVMLACFDVSTQMFVYAIIARSGVSKSTWEKKVEAYMSFGWSAEEAQLAFRKCPLLYMYSEEKIRRHLDFTMNILKLRAVELLSYTKLLTCSLEKTVIPRCCVLNVLMGKGLVEKDISVPAALSRSAESFEKVFVNKYQAEFPDVLEAYHGNIQFLGFDYKN